MPIVPRIRNIVSAAVKTVRILGNRNTPSGRALKVVSSGGNVPTRQPVVSLVTPIVPAGGAAASGARGIVQGAKTVFERATRNPFSGVTSAKGFGKAVAGRTLATVGQIEGARLIVAGASGEPYSPLGLKRALQVGLGGAFTSLPVGLAAGLYGVGKGQVNRVRDLVDVPTNQLLNIPEFPAMPNFTFTSPDVNITFPPSLGSPSLEAPFGVGIPPIAISADVSRSGGDSALILALLAGALGGGYLLGRRKRKKKRKKRKNYKR